MKDRTIEIKDDEQEIRIETERASFIPVEKDKVSLTHITDGERISYKVSIEDQFKQKKDQDVTHQVLLHSIQNLVNETKRNLETNNIRDVTPIVYLLDIHTSKEIKKLCNIIEIKEDVLVSALLENTFDLDFMNTLNKALINLCMSGKISSERILPILPEEERKLLKTLLDE
jgi:uncharacterized protein (UPF0210 family)